MLLLTLLCILPVAFSVKCPEGFTHFKRTPTARNGHTKDWCMGIFTHPDAGTRNSARSVCAHYNSTLTIPENFKEMLFLNQTFPRTANSNSTEEWYALDGQITPKCSARFIQSGAKLNFLNDKGKCNVKNDLFEFDSSNTDPSFVKSSFKLPVPNESGYQSFSQGTIYTIYKMADHIIFKVMKDFTHFDTHLGGSDRQKVNYVLCGRKP